MLIARVVVETLPGQVRVVAERMALLSGMGSLCTESDHRLIAKQAIHPRELVGNIFIGGSNKATVLRAVTEDYLRRSGVDIKLDHGVDNMAMAISLVASTRGLALMPAYAKNLLPSSVVSRPLEGEAPTIDVALGYSMSNKSPILKLFLSRRDELVAPNRKQ